MRTSDGLIKTPSGACVEPVAGVLQARLRDPSRSAQHWALVRGGAARNLALGTCMSAPGGAAGTPVAMASCARSPGRQFFLTTQKQLRGPEATCLREWFGGLALSDCTIDATQTGFALR